MLEHEIIPLYYSVSSEGYSKDWVRVIKNSIAKIAPHYTMKRQLDDYYSKFYNKESERFKALSASNNRKAKDIAAWKEAVAQRWDSVKIVSEELSDNLKTGQLESGSEIDINIVVDEQGLDNAIGIDLVVVNVDENGGEKFLKAIPLKLVNRDNNLYTFNLKYTISFIGRIKTSFRMYPSNPLLPHRQDFCYVRWF